MYLKVVGLFDQLPCDAFWSLPTSEGPEIAGGRVLTGSKAVEVGVAAAIGEAVAIGAAVVVDVEVDTGLVSHHLVTPTVGSPKTVLLQSTPPVKVLGLVNVPFAP